MLSLQKNIFGQMLSSIGSWRFRDPDVTMLNASSHASHRGTRDDCCSLLIGQHLSRSVLSLAETLDPSLLFVTNQSIISMQATSAKQRLHILQRETTRCCAPSWNQGFQK